MVPKKDGTFRIILDLSSPKGSSINDGISKENYSVRYSSFDEAVDFVFRLGPDCQMAYLECSGTISILSTQDCHLVAVLLHLFLINLPTRISLDINFCIQYSLHSTLFRRFLSGSSC